MESSDHPFQPHGHTPRPQTGLATRIGEFKSCGFFVFEGEEEAFQHNPKELHCTEQVYFSSVSKIHNTYLTW